MEQKDQQMTLLERAIKEANEWLERLERQEEDPHELAGIPLRLFSPEERFSVEEESLPQEDDESGEWSIGLSGHGWNNLYFCCHWRSQRLKIAVQVPYQTVLATDDTRIFAELEERNRKCLLSACTLVCLLLKLESEQRNYVTNNPQVSLTVVCDHEGGAYCLRDETGVVAMENSTDGVLNFLEMMQMEQDVQKDAMIFIA